MIDPNKLTTAVAGALAGAVIGWSATALQLSGRVTAVEQTLNRIETRLEIITTGAARK